MTDLTAARALSRLIPAYFFAFSGVTKPSAPESDTLPVSGRAPSTKGSWPEVYT
ncbi:Uncharacterised protein [Mycobacterium tuberculosis]|nr:Uncharacterised protein [Mycobacterium tuberculosis]